MRLSGVKTSDLRVDIINFDTDHLRRLNQVVQRALGLLPVELQKLASDLGQLERSLQGTHADNVEIPDHLLPLFKMVLLRMRRVKAAEIEEKTAKTFNHELREKLEAELAPVTECITQEWFQMTTAAKYPVLTDFLLPPIAEQQIPGRQFEPSDRARDEKFHILLAPALFLSDLDRWRAACEMRGQSVAVAYIDVDDLKAFNSKYGEPAVDRDVLPKFMTLLEGHLFARGFAYRFGGDEYGIILPNATADDATLIFTTFQKKLCSADYFGVSEMLTVSIGIFEVTPDSPFTDREVETKAAMAKKWAKEAGKNRIATFKTSTLVDNAPEVVYEGPKG